MISAISFKGLPIDRQKTPIEGANRADIANVINDAILKAFGGTTPGQTQKDNQKIFNEFGQVTKEGAEMLKKEYPGVQTLAGLRDALAEGYAKHKPDGILNIIV